ncbi:MAG: NAD(P)H-dependent oxidoreductase [bacterium]
MPHIQIILGSTREGRNGEKVAKWVAREAALRSDFTSEVLDVKEFNLPFFEGAGSPGMTGIIAPEAAKWSEAVAKGDGYIIVTPEYNHGYPAPLKNALDHLYKEWNNKPVAFVSYGGAAGGVRAAEQLRQVAAELRMASIRDSVVIPAVWAAFTSDGEPLEKESLAKTLGEVFDQLAMWADGLRTMREKAGK